MWIWRRSRSTFGEGKKTKREKNKKRRLWSVIDEFVSFLTAILMMTMMIMKMVVVWKRATIRRLWLWLDKVLGIQGTYKSAPQTEPERGADWRKCLPLPHTVCGTHIPIDSTHRMCVAGGDATARPGVTNQTLATRSAVKRSIRLRCLVNVWWFVPTLGELFEMKKGEGR